MAFDVVFIGSSATGLAALLADPGFSVRGVLCLKKRVTPALQDVAARNGFRVHTFDWIRDFSTLIEGMSPDMPFLIYQLDMLVPGHLTERNRFFNLHRGDLATNRGPNPDVWPILLGHTETAMSLHQIDDRVDAGLLIDAYRVPIEPDDDIIATRKRLEEGLPTLIRSLHAHLGGKLAGEPVVDGTYRPWVTEADFTIDAAEDDLDAIRRKILCQRIYNGAIVRDGASKHYVTGLLDVITDPKRDVADIEVNGDRLDVPSPHGLLVFKRNPEPQYPRRRSGRRRNGSSEASTWRIRPACLPKSPIHRAGSRRP